jgi:hypothetical protein
MEVAITVAIGIGVVFILLHKFGIINFGKFKVSEARSSDPLDQVHLCPLHGSMVDSLRLANSTVATVRDQQIVNIEAHKQHFAALTKGEIAMRNMNEDIVSLKVGIAYLLERSGGVPKEYNLKRKIHKEGD